MTQKLSRRRDDSVTKTSLVKVVDYVRRIITIENYFFARKTNNIVLELNLKYLPAMSILNEHMKLNSSDDPI